MGAALVLTSVVPEGASAQDTPATGAQSNWVETELDPVDGQVSWSQQMAPGTLLEVGNVGGDIAVYRAEGRAASVHAVLLGSQRELIDVVVVKHEGGYVLCALSPDDAWIRTSDEGYASPSCEPGGGGRLGGIGVDDSEIEVSLTVRVPAGVRLALRTVSGDVSSAIPVAAVTTDGEIDVYLGEVDWARELALRTTDGDITVRYASGLDVGVDAASRFERVQTDAVLEVVPIGRGGQAVKGSLRGGPAEGLPLLHLRSTDGTIRLLTGH